MHHAEYVRVLYMEDDPGLARLLEKKLTRCGYEVTLASDGRQGLALWETGAYDLLVVDHQMPVKNGLEVLRTLSERGPMPPTIMVTGQGDETVAVEALKLAASDYLIKDPAGGYLDLLPAVIERALAKHRLIEEKKRAEEELHRASAELELRVRERTAELAAALEKVQWEISERIRTEKDLRESEMRYRSLVDNIDLGVTLIAPDFTVMMTNAAQARIFGKTPADFVGMKCYEAFAKRMTVCRLCPGLKAMETGAPAEREAHSPREDGHRAHVRVQAFPIVGQDGTVSGVIEVVEDITERKRLEEQLQHAAKMEAVGRLAGCVAHDFNNILTAIIGYSTIMLKGSGGSSDHHDKLVQINRAAERAASLTRQLLAFSRKQELDRKVLDLNASIANFEKMLTRLIGEHITFRTILDPSLGKIKADPSQIEQILLNLVVNARDAMPSGGTLTIETMNWVLDENFCRSRAGLRPGPYVVLIATDTGHGMDDAIVPQIFEPFFTTKEGGNGTGLGLSTVYGIVQMHQGHIDVETIVGVGTTFRIYLPQAADIVERAIDETGYAGQVKGKETVLVVEDEEMVRELSCDILEMLGYKVLRAATPDQALWLCGQTSDSIDLLLADVVLPQMDGKSLYVRISVLFPHMKVLYMSGYTDDAIASHGVLVDGARLLQKPFAPDVLAKAVREVLDGVSEESKEGA
jgi:two-component system, cell cycle sensor histidine kinase and response regulator CckA